LQAFFLLFAALYADQSAAELLDKAEALVRTVHAQDAVALLEQAAQAPGATPESEDRIGFLYAVLGRSADATEHFHKSLALNGDFAAAHFHLGASQWLAKDYEHGLQELQKAAALAPNNPDYRYQLGAAYLELNNFADAASEFKQATTLNPNKPVFWTNYAEASRGKGDFTTAADAYAQAVKLDPKDDTVRNSFAAALVEARQPERAIEESQKVLAHPAAKLAAQMSARMNIGYAYLKIGEFDKAEKSYRAALAADPKSAAGHYDLAIALKMKDRIEAAQKEFQRAIELDPSLAEAHYSLGIASWQLGDFPAAIEQMKAAIAIRPSYAEAHYMLGITLKQSGDLDAAIPELREAIRLDPTTPGPYNTLGQILRIKGDKPASDEAFATGARLKKDKEGELANTLEQGMRGGTFPKPIGSSKR
jgi:tetratricopeptide (TPR) repeat protein